MSYGLTPEGFSVKPTAAILADINAKQLLLVSPSLDVQPTALMGVVNGIFSGALGEVWELLGALYNGMDADQAVDDQLASLALLTGTVKRPATATVVEGVSVNVDAGFHAEPGTLFANVIGDSAHLFTNLDVIDNPGGTPDDIVADWLCVDTGPVQALSGTLTEINQSVTGWNSITNPDDGIPGQDIETSSALRLRRQAELSLPGSTTAAAIRADVIELMQPSSATPTSVATTSVTVLHNDTDATDANGVPPHSIEVIARSPGATSDDDALLAALILSDKAAGDGTSGTTSKLVRDQGGETVVKFTRPVDVPLTIVLTVVADPDLPAPDTAAMKAAMVAYALATYAPGVTAYAKKLADIGAFSSSSVVDWSTITVNGGGNLAVDIRQTATLSTGDITITVT